MKAKILKIGTAVQAPDGRWLLHGWQMEHRFEDGAAAETPDGKIGGWSPEELAAMSFPPSTVRPAGGWLDLGLKF